MPRLFIGCCAAALLVLPALRAPAQARPRTDLLNLTGESTPSPNELADARLILIEKRQLVIVALAGQRARLDALQKSLADAETQIRKIIDADDSIVAFTRSLDSEKQQLTTAQHSGASPTEVAARLTEIARQQSIIIERREEIRSRYREGTLPELAREQTRTELDIIQSQAELTALDAQLAKLSPQ